MCLLIMLMICKYVNNKNQSGIDFNKDDELCSNMKNRYCYRNLQFRGVFFNGDKCIHGKFLTYFFE